MHPGNPDSLSSRKMKLQYTFRLYLNNAAGERVLGKGGAQILEAINEHGSIVAAAKNLNMSYKFVCDYLVRMKKRLRERVVVTHRGGADPGKKKGGGGTALTPLAGNLLREFGCTQRLIGNTLSSKNKMLTLQTVTSAHWNRRRTRRNTKN
jgi:molybdate transport system regulatory protein